MKKPTHHHADMGELIDSVGGVDQLASYLQYYSPIDAKGRYLPYDELRFRVASGLNVDLAWKLTRLSRLQLANRIIALGEPETECTVFFTPSIQIAISETDRFTTEAMLDWINNQIGETENLNYLLKDLIEDESISSSQLEGAATTTIAAKELIKRKREPRTPDERMIVGNFKLMMFAWENRSEPLSPELIKEFHIVGVSGIDDDKYFPGRFRTTNNVVVADENGNVVHQPPTCDGLSDRLDTISNWINQEHDNGKEYIHPMIKAIILHFCIGYEHPFHDGNGRVARALFYWFMFKSGYHAFRYIAISTLLKKAPVQYGRSYLHTENDDMDLTYFIDYQCTIINRAIKSFKKTYTANIEKIRKFNSFLYKSGLFKKLSSREQILFQVAKNGVSDMFTATEAAENLNCSYNTASAALNNLVKLNLFNKVKIGKEWIYRMNTQDSILDSWKKNDSSAYR